MAKMTKAQARKRLKEASVKVGSVQWNSLTGQINGDPVSITDTRKLYVILTDLKKIVDKMK